MNGCKIVYNYIQPNRHGDPLETLGRMFPHLLVPAPPAESHHQTVNAKSKDGHFNYLRQACCPT